MNRKIHKQGNKYLIHIYDNINKRNIAHSFNTENEARLFDESIPSKRHSLSYTKEYKMWCSAKHRAKERQLEFNIETTDIVIPSLCPVLGIPIICDQDKVSSNSPSLDRIDNSRGYVKGNIQVISQRANGLKSSASIDEIKKILSYMEAHEN